MSLRRNILAQGGGQAGLLTVQLVSVPLLIAAWGIDGFGTWAMLTALAGLLALSDLGFTFAVKNDLALRLARGDRAGARASYQSVLVLLLGSCAVLALLIAGGVLMAWHIGWLARLSQGGEVAAAIAWLAATAGLSQFFLLGCAGLRGIGRPAEEITAAATARIAEGMAVVTVALLGHGIASAAAAACLMRAVACGVLWWRLRRLAPWLRSGLRSGVPEARRDRLRLLASPALSYLLIPLAQAGLLHAPPLLLGLMSGPTGVALYAVTRTVARAGTTAATLVNHALVPEYSYAFGAGRAQRVAALIRLHQTLIGMGALAYAAILAALGLMLIHWFSGGSVTAQSALLAAIGLSVLLEMGWTACLAPRAARNAHRRIALSAPLGAAVGLGAGVALAGVIAPPVALGCGVALAHGLICGAALSAPAHTLPHGRLI
ncbi:hypothetical protein CBW24_00450 [Pacificitalea manganoxidans]|uniref:O-antigen/teichoic acid export membrane protein n=1 Tax=Pacificitalea manganoxidans TaxID=1411902 RepID=A0A291LV95_9RHOB|nr:hypothetical protein [Pacificitalea manganoxidans]ATI40629.1 hypothetical protein CBW24_00450 [Pacificitalea manganoxidans]MDR6309617.1 O-antigen/teichoic acid export membrane protein [Pacificitalea manganoxidans]